MRNRGACSRRLWPLFSGKNFPQINTVAHKENIAFRLPAAGDAGRLKVLSPPIALPPPLHHRLQTTSVADGAARDEYEVL